MFKPQLSVSVNCVKALGLRDGVYGYDIDDKFEERLIEIKELGFSAIELVLQDVFYAWTTEECAKKACEIIKRQGVKLNSVHIPYGYEWLDLASPWESDRIEIIKWLGKIFKIFEGLKPSAFVLHPGGNRCKTPSDYPKCLDNLVDSAERLADLTPAFVCVENMIAGELFGTIDKVVDFCSKTQKPQIVLDLNHVFGGAQKEAILKLGKRIKTIHVSDNDGVCERHLLPGEGTIKWMEVLSALEEVGYDGAFNYEVNSAKGYTYKQIKDNYDKLMAGYERYKNN